MTEPTLPPRPSPAVKPPEAYHLVPAKKKWKDYFFEFVLVFLAVFLGFLAENLRESSVEKNMEKEYVESFATDLKMDYNLAAGNEFSIFEQVKKIDTLQDLLYLSLQNPPDKERVVRECYKLSEFIKLFYSDFFNERTMTQLLSTGGLRLIRTQGVADSIMDYHSHLKFVEVQKQLYITSITKAVDAMYDIYDISFLKTIQLNDLFFYRDLDSLPTEFLPVSNVEMKKFIGLLENTKVIAFTYRNYLEGVRERANRLSEFLSTKYDIAQ